jgi:hypothetical protein
VAETAAQLVRQLRAEVFPAESSATQPLQAKFSDASLDSTERFKAFVELYKQQAKAGGKGLLSDPGVVRAAVEVARFTDPEHRAQIWRAMRGVDDASLVEPMLASLQQDAEEVRIAALETLAADFSGDQRVRAALQTAAASDPRSLVRAVAQRGLNGDEWWHDYVVSSLKDSSLPDSQRAEALMYALYPPDPLKDVPEGSPSNYWEILKGLDDAAVQSLVEIFPRADVFRGRESNNFLGNFAGTFMKNPAVTELLLMVLDHDSKTLNRGVAAQVLAQAHASDPRARAALAKAESGDPDAQVRDNIRQLTSSDYYMKQAAATVAQ